MLLQKKNNFNLKTQAQNRLDTINGIYIAKETRMQKMQAFKQA